MGYPYPNFCLCAFLGPYILLGGPFDFLLTKSTGPPSTLPSSMSQRPGRGPVFKFSEGLAAQQRFGSRVQDSGSLGLVGFLGLV